MKFVVVLSALVCCVYVQVSTQAVTTPLRYQLLSRYEALDSRLKTEIKRLENDKKEQLAQVLQEEGKRLEALANELKVVKDDDVNKLVYLEDKLITMEYNVANEINIFERERATQELLLSSASILREWTNKEIKSLEATKGARKEQALQTARELRRAEERIDEIAQELVKAQDQITIERYEVDLKALEVKLFLTLRALHTVTPHRLLQAPDNKTNEKNEMNQK